MIRTIIVDDEPDCIKTLRHDLSSFSNALEIVSEAFTVEQAYQSIQELNPDLIFLDIQLGNQTAFDLLKKLPNLESYIIFTTAYDEYAVVAFRYAATDYLLKPINPKELKEAVEKVENQLKNENSSQNITQLIELIKERKGVLIPISQMEKVMIHPDDVIRVESDGSYVDIYLNSDKNYKKVSRSLREMEELLNFPEFFRTHKSHLLNTKYIESISTKDGVIIRLKNGDSIPCAQRKWKKLSQHL